MVCPDLSKRVIRVAGLLVLAGALTGSLSGCTSWGWLGHEGRVYDGPLLRPDQVSIFICADECEVRVLREGSLGELQVTKRLLATVQPSIPALKYVAARDHLVGKLATRKHSFFVPCVFEMRPGTYTLLVSFHDDIPGLASYQSGYVDLQIDAHPGHVYYLYPIVHQGQRGERSRFQPGVVACAWDGDFQRSLDSTPGNTVRFWGRTVKSMGQIKGKPVTGSAVKERVSKYLQGERPVLAK